MGHSIPNRSSSKFPTAQQPVNFSSSRSGTSFYTSRPISPIFDARYLVTSKMEEEVHPDLEMVKAAMMVCTICSVMLSSMLNLA